MSERFVLSFIKWEKVVGNIYSFYFDRKDYRFDFLPGEYIRMTLDIKRPDSRGSSRYFTVASSPLNKKYLIITTKVIRSTFKKRLLALKAGEKVKFFGPMGNFILNKKDKRPKVFLAGGMGITTFYSMLLYYAQTKSSQAFTLIASFTDTDSFIYEEELTKISKQNPNIRIIYLAGRISKDLISKYVDTLDGEFYVVGPPAFVEATKEILLGLGIKEDINFEDFTGY